MNVRDKMLQAYFKVVEHILTDEQVSTSSRCFHRTKKYACFVEVRRLNDDEYLPVEMSSITKYNKEIT